MPLNDSSYPSPPGESPAGRRRSSFSWITLLMLVVACALGLSFVPGMRARVDSLLAQAAPPSMNSAVTVWTNKQTGNYYCQGSREYGKGAGSYMQQGEALTAGYQPELSQYCKAITAKGHTGR